MLPVYIICHDLVYNFKELCFANSLLVKWQVYFGVHDHDSLGRKMLIVLHILPSISYMNQILVQPFHFYSVGSS